MEEDSKSSENAEKSDSKIGDKSEVETKEPEKKDFEMPTKEPPKSDISFDLSKIPVDLIEKRRAEEEKRKSAELKSKPVANLELVNASDSDSDNEDSETKS